MTAAVVGALVLAGSSGPLRSVLGWGVAAVVAASLHPAAALAVAAAAAAVGRTRRQKDRTRPDGPLRLADHVALGLRAGLTLENALAEAADGVGGPEGAEVAATLRRARRAGLGPALAGATGVGERLYRITERAARTGAPLGAAVEALAEELRHEDHMRRVAESRRLPVRLLLPLALLILPGFVLVVVGPALVTSLARLDIGW